ncbi:MAG: F0F1 ATP synthase subunit A [Chloroflexi bacterium]|nr:F0F1 ATP synthase subunit A [Chloroflexota bacterium]MCI0576849.1 F0F1 ATP synthase subunit A [Chloroflexota bacterium]MCI0649440.1 F0F1 ATP synthase subunit A [Chloroflexota bacterium]MCI0730760.1 F0F1 ATP synthase subunit A [Chloroflexota bacterium]
MKKRYVVVIAVILMIAAGLVIPPVRPTIQLPGEVLLDWSEASLGFLEGPGAFGQGLTNTLIGTALAYLVIIVIVLLARPGSRTSDEVPTGLYNMIEMIIEGAYGYVQNVAGKYAKNFFPFFMTFVLLILTANWLELIPGVDSIGIKEDLGHHRVEVAEREAEAAGEELTAEEREQIEAEAHNEGGRFQGPFLLAAGEGEGGQQIVPFVRAAATDLNFTLALALLSVLFTQYFGFKALGLGYLRKFIQFDANKIARNPLGAIDPVVGILELVSEISKILSFAFRLFGNIFAGQVLLFVIGSLLGVALVGVYGLEFFVGAIQALVFALLTLTFMAGATTAHHGGDEHH